MKVLPVEECVYDRFVPLGEMLPQADFITIHVPLTPHTQHMISTKEFNLMKNGVMLIDCSRGGVVDQEALYQALFREKLDGAALDVFEEEPPKNSKLLTLNNVIATPHMGAQTYEAQLKASIQIAKAVIEALEKTCELKHLVDIRPFKAIRYTQKAGDPENLITQPYDKIDPEMQKEYYQKSPYNYCRLILPMEENKYQMAQQRIEQWLKEGILAKETEPVIFVSRQEFTLMEKNMSAQE